MENALICSIDNVPGTVPRYEYTTINFAHQIPEIKYRNPVAFRYLIATFLSMRLPENGKIVLVK